MLHGVTGMLNHTSLSNSSWFSNSSYTEIEDTNISQCSVSFMESVSLVISGALRVHQSSFHVRNQTVRIHNSTTVFSSISKTDVLAVLSVVASKLYIDGNSEVVFTRLNISGNSSALVAIASTVFLQDNASLKLTGNFASEGASILTTLGTTVTISNHSSLNFSHNTVRSAWGHFAGFDGTWRAHNDAIKLHPMVENSSNLQD